MLLEKINTLSRAVQNEAKKNQGSEMVFQVGTFGLFFVPYLTDSR